MPLRNQIYNTALMRMTKAQERMVERLIHAIRVSDYADNPDYEFKEIEVSQFDFDTLPTSYHPLVFLYTVVGRKNDEGTMAEAFARSRRNICIGPRGGLRLLNAKFKKSRARGFRTAVHGITE